MVSHSFCCCFVVVAVVLEFNTQVKMVIKMPNQDK